MNHPANIASVELIILDVDGGEMLNACLESIDRQTVRPARVIVFDNGSAVPVSARIASHHQFELVVERSETNLGFTGGINRAMKLVTSPFVGWINNDAVLDPEWLEALASEFARDEKLAAVQGWIRRDERLLDGAGIEIGSGTFVQAGHGQAIDSYAPSAKPWGVSATAAMYRVTALREVALGSDVLHPAFFAWYEDVELCARLHERGWHTAVIPRVVASHAGSRSGAMIGARAIFLRTRNRYLTARLHPGVGRTRSLFAEDLRLLARAALAGRFGEVGQIVRGLWAGVTEKRIEN